eukprot:jgi/Pico_ML_1/52340/g3057.t2
MAIHEDPLAEAEAFQSGWDDELRLFRNDCRSPARRYVAKQEAVASAKSAFIDDVDAVGVVPAMSRVVARGQDPPPSLPHNRHLPSRTDAHDNRRILRGEQTDPFR